MALPRERIVQTALLLFHQQGYNSTGINQIIAEANVAKATFYQHFKSKDELCIVFLHARHDLWFSELRNFVSNFQDSKDKVLACFDFLIYMNHKEHFRGCSFLNILSEIASEQERILIVIQNHKADLRKFFSDEIKNDVVADHVFLLFESSIIESQLFRSNELIEKSKVIINNLL